MGISLRIIKQPTWSPFFCWPGLLLLIPTTTCPMLASKDVLSPTLMRPLPGTSSTLVSSRWPQQPLQPSSTSTRPPPRETSTTWAWASSAEPAMAFPSEATSPPPLTCLTAPLTYWPDPALTLPNFTSSAALLSLCQFKKTKWVFGNVEHATEVRTVYGYNRKILV